MSCSKDALDSSEAPVVPEKYLILECCCLSELLDSFGVGEGGFFCGFGCCECVCCGFSEFFDAFGVGFDVFGVGCYVFVVG